MTRPERSATLTWRASTSPRGGLQRPSTSSARACAGNPHHPALQGLWGYAALSAQTQVKDEALANELLAGLQSLPADTPDAWFWISRALAARGDAVGAAAARARAKELAPALGSRRYGQRLLHGR